MFLGKIAVFINNLGSVSQLEMGNIKNEVVNWLSKLLNLLFL